MIRRFARDPLAHFLVLGAILWLAMGWRGDPVDPASRSITVTRQRQAALAANFEQLMGRPPTDQEQAGLVAGDVREEVLSREALRLGLDQDDPVIRRRLAKKMDELAEAEVENADPGDAELSRWLANHPERFVDDVTVSFAQAVYPNEASARAALPKMGNRAVAPQDAMDLPAAVDAMTMTEVTRRFGLQFAGELAKLQPDKRWQGPVPSGLGWHLVRLDQRAVGALPPLSAVRPQVLDDWRSATMAARREAADHLLESAYTIRIAR